MNICYKSKTTNLNTVISGDICVELEDTYKITSADTTIKISTDEYSIDTKQHTYYIFKATVEGAVIFN